MRPMPEPSSPEVVLVEPPSVDDVYALLRGVIDPELGSDIVELGMARDVRVEPDGAVAVKIALTTAGCPLRAQIKKDVITRLESTPGVSGVDIEWAELTQDEKAAAMARARQNIAKRAGTTAIPASTRVLMIASGKGGVGKSSVTVNLAVALALRGLRVGLIDADIWGYSVPRMLGVEGRLEGAEDDRLIQPASRDIGPASDRCSSTASSASGSACSATPSSR